MPVHIYIAFRFHGNFYHSYRGDTPDELGFGKDIRIIRHLINTLDNFNARDIPVCGTWDFENYFSLETIMPEHCPDIITDLQRRVRDGQDDVELMAYNNGLISAHTAREFEVVIQRGITNAQGSGLRDLFGDNFQGMVRPQEMMYTPIHLKLYPAYGVTAISLFYSALPFNGFSNFVPELSFIERYNPLTLTYPGIDETMTLMPGVNIGDLGDHLTLRRWVKQMRRQQLALDTPQDALLLIDMDADDEFWVGFEIPVIDKFLSTTKGLKGLINNIADLDYVRFTTPDRYLKDHPPVGTITIGQDTADGSFDGFSSWAEKWSNTRLWTGLERARILELQAKRLRIDEGSAVVEDLLRESFETRIKILSTTHFGLAAPVMNLTRAGVARELVNQAVETAAQAFAHLAEKPTAGHFSLIDYIRGDSTTHIQYQARPSRALIRLPLQENAPDDLTLKDATGQSVPATILKSGWGREIVFIETFQPEEQKDYVLEPRQSLEPSPSAVTADIATLQNEFIQLNFDSQGQIASTLLAGNELAHNKFITSGVTYGRERYEVETWVLEPFSRGLIGGQRLRGGCKLAGRYPVQFEHEILLTAGLPYIYVRTVVDYPATPHQGYNRAQAERLEQTWDARWKEIRPCEISPALAGRAESPLRVWKHNHCDHVSTFSLDYGQFSKNVELDSVNNQVTHGWVAVSDGEQGLLIAQNADVASNLAFCRLRTRQDGPNSRVLLNPFGTYWGRQYRYGIADTGLGNLLATTFSASDHISPYAPSYNGRRQEFSLLIAPYRGDAPPESLRYDAEAFAYPYVVLNDAEFIAPPAHRSWNGPGLGK
jgi:hypothetical protein